MRMPEEVSGLAGRLNGIGNGVEWSTSVMVLKSRIVRVQKYDDGKNALQTCCRKC